MARRRDNQSSTRDAEDVVRAAAEALAQQLKAAGDHSKN